METAAFSLDGGDRNVGVIYLPEDRDGPLAVLVIAHDWGASRAFTPFTGALCAAAVGAGMAVVAFDFFGCGETGGDFASMTYGRWAANLRDVCLYIEAQEWAASGKIGAVGTSSGSVAVLRCAIGLYPLAFAVSVATCLGPYIHMPEGPAKLLAENLPSLLAGGTVALYGVEFGLGFFTDFLAGAPAYGLHNATCPVFFLQGGADSIYRRSDAAMGYDLLRARGLPARHLELEGGDHTLSRVPEAATGAVMDWLRDPAALPVLYAVPLS